jgi:UDP-N-acetylmuramoyl-tripeptide--D-alanyl-D-alanine ligase
MAELGGYTDEAHAEVARAVEQIGIDEVIAIGPHARAYGGHWAATRDEALAVLEELLRPGDCVLVKGARVLELERIAEALTTVNHQ